MNPDEISELMSKGGVLLPPGAPIPAPPVMLEVDFGEAGGGKKKVLFLQTVVAALGDQVIAGIAAVTANLVTRSVRAMLQAEGVIAPDPEPPASQEPENEVQSSSITTSTEDIL